MLTVHFLRELWRFKEYGLFRLYKLTIFTNNKLNAFPNDRSIIAALNPRRIEN